MSHFIPAVPMRNCLGQPSCMSSPFEPFPIAILNGTCSLNLVRTEIRSVNRVLLN